MAQKRHDSSNTNYKALIVAVLVGIGVVAGLNRVISASVSRPVAKPEAVVAATGTAPAPQTEREIREKLKAKPYLDYIGNPKAANQHLNDLAEQSGGDLTRLSSEDRAWLDNITQGHSAEMLRSRVPGPKKEAKRASKD